MDGGFDFILKEASYIAEKKHESHFAVTYSGEIVTVPLVRNRVFRPFSAVPGRVPVPPVHGPRRARLSWSRVESARLVALAFRNSKLVNAKVVVVPDTVSALFPQFKEDLSDELRLIHSRTASREPSNRLFYFRRRGGESE